MFFDVEVVLGVYLLKILLELGKSECVAFLVRAVSVLLLDLQALIGQMHLIRVIRQVILIR